MCPAHQCHFLLKIRVLLTALAVAVASVAIVAALIDLKIQLCLQRLPIPIDSILDRKANILPVSSGSIHRVISALKINRGELE